MMQLQLGAGNTSRPHQSLRNITFDIRYCSSSAYDLLLHSLIPVTLNRGHHYRLPC